MDRYQNFILSITKALKEPLPGEAAHNRLSWFKRRSFKEEVVPNPSYKESAVMILIWPADNGLRCLLIRRPDYEGVHSGQIAFPGGGREASDSDLLQTAIRETWEETGVQLPTDKVVGALSPLYIPVSNYLVYPFIACLKEKPIWNPDPMEVSALIEFDLLLILDEKQLKRKSRLMKPGLNAEAPYYDIAGSEVWGATGMMLSELSDILRKISVF
jgi:8-oxo-dGTP pyrophosphatase MutT (NUDIX family)